MPAYNFQKQFVPLIESGEKWTTIRKPRKRPTKADDTLYLYTGMRTKWCHLIGRSIALHVTPMWILKDAIWLQSPVGRFIEQSHTQAERIARVDGFADLASFYEWFARTHPGSHIFELIAWKPLKKRGPDGA